MKEHDLFLVDDRIVPEMPRVLGRSWLEAKKWVWSFICYGELDAPSVLSHSQSDIS